MAVRSRIEKKISLMGKERGSKNEKRIYNALTRLMDSDDLDYFFIDFYETQRLSLEDKAGIDFVVHAMEKDADLVEIDEIPIQVKSSAQSALKHMECYPEIPVIVVKPSKTEEELEKELDGIIKSKLGLKSED